ncbi:ERF family protein [Staphylococcus chromogenes]|uniref:ERF family protein n=1 Tax=Staphylococcus chromogenes TaxID=46126 RepID=UPI002904B23F|nr:ERF family protein [Staphylococcus chromogenes]MDU0476498.1 ERF family protein [Staphylococcus chromogenes]
MAAELNLYQRINEAKHSMEGFVKDTKGYQYSYVSGSQVLHKLNPELYKNGINITFKTSEPNFQQITVFVKGKEKVEFLVSLNVHYTITNVDKPEEKIESTIFAIGQQDDSSKALGTALTYSERYFLMKFFGLPTDEDDADAKQKQIQYSTSSVRLKELLKEEADRFIKIATESNVYEKYQKQIEKLKNMDVDSLDKSQMNQTRNSIKKWLGEIE